MRLPILEGQFNTYTGEGVAQVINQNCAASPLRWKKETVRRARPTQKMLYRQAGRRRRKAHLSTNSGRKGDKRYVGRIVVAGSPGKVHRRRHRPWRCWAPRKPSQGGVCGRVHTFLTVCTHDDRHRLAPTQPNRTKVGRAQRQQASKRTQGHATMLLTQCGRKGERKKQKKHRGTKKAKDGRQTDHVNDPQARK